MSLECCICTDSLKNEESTVSSTPCGHVYHTECILQWVDKCQNQANCPICRETFSPVDVVPLKGIADDDIAAIAKAISERVRIKNEVTSPPLQTDQQRFFELYGHLLLDDFDSSDDSYEEDPQDEMNPIDALNFESHNGGITTNPLNDYDQNDVLDDLVHNFIINDVNNDVLNVGNASDEDNDHNNVIDDPDDDEQNEFIDDSDYFDLMIGIDQNDANDDVNDVLSAGSNHYSENNDDEVAHDFDIDINDEYDNDPDDFDGNDFLDDD
ncbi:coiled-coil domain-containing protein 1-like [Chironomus tepperi]|uniref:coiled-coil domain-containing protein 1-like n=1 Tax=Chironomus tepperi TaxID=113505 RepID=UPI00391FC05F